MKDLLEQLTSHARETANLKSIEELLNWDQRTYMPSSAADYRGEQVALLSRTVHQRVTDPRRGEWLNELKADPNLTGDAKVIVDRLFKQFEKERKVPVELVERLTRARVSAHEAWITARDANKFQVFQPHLTTILDLLKEKTAAIGFADSPYDVLLDDYEPDAKATEITAVFDQLKMGLVPLLNQIRDSHKQPNSELLHQDYPINKQKALGIRAAREIGFDFDAGRIDETHHPFCCTVGPSDCRLTTRYDPKYFSSAFFGTIHEAGHGLYEQGLRKDQFGLPTGEYCSLGIHESQSRLWENMVARSRPFWIHFYPQIKSAFPTALGSVDLEDFYQAVNHVQSSLIRVEADELTYSLHIIIRFELEQELLDGRLEVANLPHAWNEKYQQYLGIQPESDSDGVLQDVHWSEALFGYFPTYALGNLYAAQFFEAAEESVGPLDDLFARGEFRPLLDWLRGNVHQIGRSLSANEIVERASGKSLSPEPMLSYVTNKYSEIYEL